MVERNTPELRAPGRTAVPASVAARDANVTDSTMRRWLADGVVDGYVVQRDAKRRHYVYVDSLDRVRGGASAPAGNSAATPDTAKLQERAAQYEAAFNLSAACVEELLTALRTDDEAVRAHALHAVAVYQQRIINVFSPVSSELMG